MPEVQWDAQTHKDLKFHVMSTPPNGNTPASAQALLGDNLEMAVGIGEKSVYFALGKNWLDAVKKVVDDSAANPGKATLPMQLIVAAKPIAETVAAGAKLDGKEQEAAMADMVVSALSQSEGRDHVRIVAEPIENGVRTRIEIESGAIQAIATAGPWPRRCRAPNERSTSSRRRQPVLLRAPIFRGVDWRQSTPLLF